MLGDRTCLFADLVNDAACRAPSKQHGRCTSQHFNPLYIESVTVVLRNVAHAIKVNITGGTKTAQADVVPNPATFTGFKRDADHVFKCAFKAVFALVVNQLFIDHGERLRNVLCRYRYFAHACNAALISLGGAVTRTGNGYGSQGFAVGLPRADGR